MFCVLPCQSLHKLCDGSCKHLQVPIIIITTTSTGHFCTAAVSATAASSTATVLNWPIKCLLRYTSISSTVDALMGQGSFKPLLCCADVLLQPGRSVGVA
jgi:hypothetical protein